MRKTPLGVTGTVLYQTLSYIIAQATTDEKVNTENYLVLGGGGGGQKWRDLVVHIYIYYSP